MGACNSPNNKHKNTYKKRDNEKNKKKITIQKKQ